MGLKENLEQVKARIDEASHGRKIKLVAVTKNQPIEKIRELFSLGQHVFGESRVQELAKKAPLLPEAEWHFIGSLQSGKARKVAGLVDWVHSVDSLKLARKLDGAAKELNKKINVFVEVNIADEPTKRGIKKTELKNFLIELKPLTRLNVQGLMCMAPWVNPEKTRPYFREMKKLAEENGLKELSMGMSNDFVQAVEEGATIVRVGTALFK